MLIKVKGKLWWERLRENIMIKIITPRVGHLGLIPEEEFSIRE